MKLRLHTASMRLRLAPPEVAAIGRGEAVTTEIHLPQGTAFRYTLMVAPVAAVSALLQGGTLTVTLPHQLATDWANTDQIALAAVLPLSGGSLAVLIEKDFACLHPRAGEDDQTTFPNPKGPAPA